MDPRSLVPASLGEIRDVTRMTLGMSGASTYSVATSSGDYVLRLHKGDRATWEHAVAMQRLAAERGIAPRIVHTDDEALATVSQKIEGVNFGAAASRPESRNAAFGGLVTRLIELQSIPMDGASPFDTFGFADRVWAREAARPGFPEWAIPLGERRAEAARIVQSDTRRVFSHNDLNPANMVWDGNQLWLLDWGGAGPAHPHLDLASISVFMSLPEEARLGLLAAVLRAPVDAAEARIFAAARDFCRLSYGAVFLSLVPDLVAAAIAPRDQTPTLAECWALGAAGKIAITEPTGQALIGAALLRGP